MKKDEKRLSKINEKVNDVRMELNEQKDVLFYLLNRIAELAAEVDSLEIDLDREDE